MTLLAPVPASSAALPSRQKRHLPSVESRPDRLSSMSTAQRQGSPVEDESQRTPTTATYANPDGSWTTKAYAGVVRAPEDDSAWVAVDPSVVKKHGRYGPAAVPFDVHYSDGGDKKLGSLDTGSRASVEVGWPSKLPGAHGEGRQADVRRRSGHRR
ncbi:hypothetical protein ABIE44_003228 [Marmoricola sp. OAE513]|uniref:hypothetical protein n=1 Tax=Marmoricola sp. OAE513 TaxID=2817894 RepID=UPI003395953D